MDETTHLELMALAAETRTLELLLTSLCNRLAMDQATRVHVERAFDQAMNTAEHVALARGEKVPLEHTERVMELLEHMRAMALGPSTAPKREM
jgi:hypothetical protein